MNEWMNALFCRPALVCHTAFFWPSLCYFFGVLLRILCSIRLIRFIPPVAYLSTICFLGPSIDQPIIQPTNPHTNHPTNHQTLSMMPETRAAPPPKKRFTFVSNSEMDENVLPQWQDSPTTWTWSAFAKPLRRISVAMVPSKRIWKWEKSSNWVETNEPMSRTFWWIRRFVMPQALCCTVSKQIFVAPISILVHTLYLLRLNWRRSWQSKERRIDVPSVQLVVVGLSLFWEN